jgi:hypothetical protein
MLLTSPSYVLHRNREQTYCLGVDEISPWGWVKEKLGHLILCELIQYRLGKRWMNRYVAWASPLAKSERGKDPAWRGADTAPIYVWFDLHCPANLATYRRRVVTLDMSAEDWERFPKERA